MTPPLPADISCPWGNDRLTINISHRKTRKARLKKSAFGFPASWLYSSHIRFFFFGLFKCSCAVLRSFIFFFCCQLPPSAGKLLDGHFSGTCPSSHERHQVRSVAVAVVVRGSLRGDCLRGPNWNVPRETQMVLKWSKGLKYEPAIGEAAPLHARFKLRYLPIYIFLHIEEVQHKFQKHWHIARGTKRYQSAGYSNRLPHILKLRVAYIEPNTLDLV